MNVGGFGPIDIVSRVGNSKQELTKAAAPAESSRSVLSTDKSTGKSTGNLKDTSKSFSSELSKERSKLADKKVSESNENIAGAAGVTSAGTAVSNVRSKSETSAEGPREVSALREPNRGQDPAQTRPIASPDGTVPGAVAPQESVTGADVAPPIASDTSDQVDERINSIVESLEQTADTELSMRHLSMRDFLGKMKSEFGIEPQAVVKAFAGLDAAALMAPPDETAEAVLSQLKLTPEQLPKAERFYREMLNQTGESALNETLAGVGAGMTLKVMSEQDVALEKLQSSISNLNNMFARRAEQSQLGESAALNEVLNPTPTDVAVDASIDATPTETTELPATEKESSGSKFAAIGAALSSAALNLNVGSSAETAGKDSNSSGGNRSDAKVAKTEYSSIEAALAASGFEVPPGGEKASVPLAAGTSTAAALATSMLSNTEAESTGNAQELVRHAQILMKNGGGEMKMQLKPEGIGDVTLKVSVKDGQVAIQMLTENDSAKKLLESNLDDLKTSLAQNKLHVDAMKIEVGTEFAKQRFEQAQQDASREQARQMAQDFMGQFRQDREGFRQGFGESLGFKNYQQPRRNSLPEIEPVVAASGSQQKSGERRLNLVA